MKKICLFFVTVFLMTLTAAYAADWDKGAAAYSTGDYATAFVEFSELAKSGNASAQYSLGLMYDNGYGAVQNYAEAVKWYTLAAEQGDARAQFNLAVMYELGKVFVEGSAVHAWADAKKLTVKWYTLSAEQGYAPAQKNLGVIYYRIGFTQDFVLAHMWANVAAANGNRSGAKDRDLAAKEMTQADITKAQEMASKCMASNYENCGY